MVQTRRETIEYTYANRRNTVNANKITSERVIAVDSNWK